MKKRNKYTILFILIILITVGTLLAAYINTPEIPPYSPSLYFAVAFTIASTLWFGVWGLVAAYFGCFIGAGLMGDVPFSINLYWSLADVWQGLIPLIAFRMLNADIGLKKRRDFLIFLAFGWLLNNLVGAIWGAGMLVTSQGYTLGDFPKLFTDWFISNLVVNILITPLLLKYVTPYLQKAGLLVKWVHFKGSARAIKFNNSYGV